MKIGAQISLGGSVAPSNPLPTLRPCIANYKPSNGDRRHEIMLNLKQCQVRKNHAHQKWLRPGRKLFYQSYCQGINWGISLTLMSLVFSFKHYQTKLWNWKEKWSDGKHSKVRLTGMCTVSATGEKLPLLVIGKSKNSRCFKNAKFLPCQCKGQPKSWMDTEIFKDWIKHLDLIFLGQNRKVAFIINNCPAHPDVPGLTVIDLISLPPNTTSVT